MKTVQTSIRVNPDLWDEFRIEAIKRKVTASELLEMTIKKELKK